MWYGVENSAMRKVASVAVVERQARVLDFGCRMGGRGKGYIGSFIM